MTKRLHTFPAKVLLFGEYTVIAGSDALAMPFSRFRASWVFNPGGSNPPSWIDTFNKYLSEINKDLHRSHRLDMIRWHDDLQKGLFFESNIPSGKGLGSSGALVAALFNNYRCHREMPVHRHSLQKDLGLIESFFHGSSSGLDPLVSYVKNAVRVSKDRDPEKVALPEKQYPLVHALLDSGTKRKTKPLVRFFRECYQNATFRMQLEENYLPHVNNAISAYIFGQSELLSRSHRMISEYQWLHFRPMIPNSIHATWKKGLDTGLYSVKLCGAGGGGYFLVLFESDSACKKFHTLQSDPSRLIPLHQGSK